MVIFALFCDTVIYKKHFLFLWLTMYALELRSRVSKLFKAVTVNVSGMEAHLLHTPYLNIVEQLLPI